MFNLLKTPNFSGKIGFARADMTPAIGIYSKNWGASTKSILTKNHSPIMIHVVTFSSSEGQYVLATFDLVTFPNHLEYTPKSLIASISKEFEIPEANIILHCTHTHSGPSVDINRAQEPGGEKILPFLESLKANLMKAIKASILNEEEAVLEWETGTSPLATNRDFMNNDRVVVGFNPVIEADQTLLVGRVTNSNCQEMFYLVHYACHPTTLAWDNEHFSSDYVGVLRSTVEKLSGKPCVFLLGSAGDQAPKNQYKGDTNWAEKNGKILAYSAMSLIESMNAPQKQISFSRVVESGAPLAVWDQIDYRAQANTKSEIINLSLKIKDSYPKMAQLLDQKAKCKDHFLLERINRSISLRKAIGDVDQLESPLWVWQLGRTFMIAVPNEAYSYLQKTLREDFPEYAVLPLNLANGAQSYLPHQQQYDRLDTYAVWVALFERGSLEIVYEAIKSSIQNMIRKDELCQAQTQN